jgi:phage terminase large subunit
VYFPHLKSNVRLQIFFGGSSSGKSYFLAQRVVLDVLTGQRNYLICRAVARTLKRSVFNEITKAISNFKLDKLFIINKTDLTITCINGFQILFAGLDDVEKMKSITPQKGVLTDIWIEEATEISYSAFKQLNKRLRGKTNVNKRITMSFNPIYKTHWIFEQFFLLWDDSKTIYQSEDLLIVKTIYKDNKFLSKDDIRELENETDKYYHEVYTKGNWGIIGNVIFKNWQTQDLSNMDFGLIESGLDFGLTDPNAYIKMSYNKNRKTLYIVGEMYASELSIDELDEEMSKIYERELIIADCAEAQTIKTLFKRGYIIKSCKKGKGSVEFGYKWLKQQNIIIDISCVNTIKEFTLHKYREDKDGNPLNVPEDRNNHTIDAIRYGMQYQMAESIGSGVY